MEIQKTVKKEKTGGRWYTRLFKTLLYDEAKEQLSRTALMNFVFFMLAVGLAILSIVLPFVSTVAIPETVYIYISGLTGGSFLQYSYGKKIRKPKVKEIYNEDDPI